MLKFKFYWLTFLFLFLNPDNLFSQAPYKFTEKDCKICKVDCADIEPQSDCFEITDKGVAKKILVFTIRFSAKNTQFFVVLKDDAQCNSLLSFEGASYEFIARKGSVYPDIQTLYHLGWDDHPYRYYRFNVDKYIDYSVAQRNSLNSDGLKFLKEGKINEAIDALLIASQMAGGSSEIFNNLGFAFYKSGDFKEAHFNLEKALEIEPKRWTTYLNLGDLYYDNKDYYMAIKNYKRLLEAKPDYKNKKDVEKIISELLINFSNISKPFILDSMDRATQKVVYSKSDNGTITRKEYFGKEHLFSNIALKNGVEDGPYLIYWSDGGIRLKGQYINGKKIGKFTAYDLKGKILKEKVFEIGDNSTDIIIPNKDF
jgi:tetratricopeptide (TPR) repeat protein